MLVALPTFIFFTALAISSSFIPSPFSAFFLLTLCVLSWFHIFVLLVFFVIFILISFISTSIPPNNFVKCILHSFFICHFLSFLSSFFAYLCTPMLPSHSSYFSTLLHFLFFISFFSRASLNSFFYPQYSLPYFLYHFCIFCIFFTFFLCSFYSTNPCDLSSFFIYLSFFFLIL